jgi:hypothetical protein
VFLAVRPTSRSQARVKELVELRLQVLVVDITSDACESKKEIMRLRGSQSVLLGLESSYDNSKTIIILSLDISKNISLSPY